MGDQECPLDASSVPARASFSGGRSRSVARHWPVRDEGRSASGEERGPHDNLEDTLGVLLARSWLRTAMLGVPGRLRRAWPERLGTLQHGLPAILRARSTNVGQGPSHKVPRPAKALNGPRFGGQGPGDPAHTSSSRAPCAMSSRPRARISQAAARS